MLSDPYGEDKTHQACSCSYQAMRYNDRNRENVFSRLI